MHFGFVKARNRRMENWNSPRITRMQRIAADFSKGRHFFQ